MLTIVSLQNFSTREHDDRKSGHIYNNLSRNFNISDYTHLVYQMKFIVANNTGGALIKWQEENLSKL